MGRSERGLGVVLLFGTLIAAAPPLAYLARSWLARVAVEGHSMQPTLAPGDWLLVDPDAYRLRRPQVGELVVAIAPRSPTRLVVKRVAAINSDGSIRLAGDTPGHAGDDGLAALMPRAVLGRPWFRYWPVARVSRVS